MTTIRTRPYPDDGAAVTGPGRPGPASRTRRYQLTINTADYPAGSYTVSFAAGSDPTTHTAQVVVP